MWNANDISVYLHICMLIGTHTRTPVSDYLHVSTDIYIHTYILRQCADLCTTANIDIWAIARGHLFGCEAFDVDVRLCRCLLCFSFASVLFLLCLFFLLLGFGFVLSLATALRFGCLHAASPRNLAAWASCPCAVRRAHANFLSAWHLPSASRRIKKKKKHKEENTLKAIKWAIFTINGKIKYRFFSIFGPVWRFDAQVLRGFDIWVHCIGFWF